MTFNPIYDLESLTESQRQEYVKAVCKHMGVPEGLNLVALTYVDETEGPQRLVAYAKRGATENVRNNLKISIESLTSQMIGGSIVFTAVAKDPSGRREISTGSKWIEGLSGTQLDDGIMTAQTRALRRVTLQFIGAGVLDESEVSQRRIIHIPSASPIPPAQPTVKPANEPGKDVTMAAPAPFANGSIIPKSVETVEDVYNDLRKEAVAKLNADAKLEEEAKAFFSSQPTEAKKTRKPRGPNKKKIDLGPSEPPIAPISVLETPLTGVTVTQTGTIGQEPVPQPITATFPTPVPVTPVPVAAAPLAAPKPKLSPDEVRPFRQRLFKLVNEYLEPHGMVPKEGFGNGDKMRAFARLMYPEITNLNDLDSTQFEKYLSVLEQKVQTIGPAATVKFIEESIGI